MEEGEDLSNRVFFVGYQDISSEYVAPAIKSREKQVVDEESKNLKQNWTKKFLENGGLSYAFDVFLNCSSHVASGDRFRMQELKFIFSILRVYLTAAITAQNKDI